MKKLLITASLAAATTLSAQIDFSQTRFGISAGPNYSRVRNAHNPSGPRYTFQAGVMALIPVDSNEQFYIQPELVYYGAGESGKDKNYKNRAGSGYDAMYANSYVSLPVYFKAYFSEAENEFFGLLGPRFNFLVGQKVTDSPKLVYTVDGDPAHPGINGKAAAFNFAIGAGVGYSYKRQLELGLRYDIGVSNTYPKMVESWTKDPDTEKKKSEQVLSLTLSYIFQ